MSITNELKFDENGLIPAVVQHDVSGRILMVAYMNVQALEQTLLTNVATFYSRSRKTLWVKGETSGNRLHVQKILADCDTDCLVVKVLPDGPACHTGNETCFYRELDASGLTEKMDRADASVLQDVYNVVLDRKQHPKEGSYTNYLFDKGIDKMLKKVGEETSEVIIGAKNEGNAEVRYEIADLLYHLSVLMVEKDLTWKEVYQELASRYAK